MSNQPPSERPQDPSGPGSDAGGELPNYAPPEYTNPQPGYGEPQQGAAVQPYAYGYGQPVYGPPPTNTLAIISLITSFFVPVAGIICGHVSLSQIRRTGEGGRGLAIAGLVISYVYVAFVVIYILVILVIVLNAGGF